MNIQEYISSGILELYASGNVSPQEKQEVECMSHIYPEIKEELLRTQQTLEAYAKAHAVTPPAHLRAKILAQLNDATAVQSTQSASVTETPMPQVSEVTLPQRTADVRPKMEVTYTKKSSNIWMYATAASLLLCAAIGYWFANVAEGLQTKVAALEQNISENEAQTAQLEADINIYQNPAYRKILLPGIKEKSPNSLATIYWNKENREVRIIANSLPAPAQGKQYQLWAIQDGKPVDLGMLPSVVTNDTLLKMKTIENPQAFAITLEQEGGVPSPTMTEMYVMGGI